MPGITGPSPNAGKPVAGIEIVGSPVNQPGVQQAGALHLNEVISYRDGSVDVVGYFPPPPTGETLSESAPLYVDRASGRSFDALPANVRRDVQEGREHYKLDVAPTQTQSLTQLARAQDAQWKSYNDNPLPYDGVGQIYHNSNGAMNASFRAAGRDDVSVRLERDLSSLPEHALQQIKMAPGMTPDRAELVEVGQRKLAGLPTAPGVGNPPTIAEIEGRGERNIGHDHSAHSTLFKRIVDSGRGATAALGGLESAAKGEIDRVMTSPATIKGHVEQGVRDFINEQMRERLRAAGISSMTDWNGNPRTGSFIHADENVAIQHTGRGTGVVYDTKEHLGGVVPPVGPLLDVSHDGQVATRASERPGLGLG